MQIKFQQRPKRPDPESWHTWFAWHPVRTSEIDLRWLERVERRIVRWVGHSVDEPPLPVYAYRRAREGKTDG